jgi:diketogulonate reductase-like aldo/keto reductase
MEEHPMPKLRLPDGEVLPALGLGTWTYGESSARRGAEVRALREALDLGYRLLDTAEMYGEGGAEEVIGEAVAGALRGGLARDSLFIVSKVYPHHASAAGVVAACERSLRRLKLDCIDLYLLHWRGAEPLAATVRGFEALRAAGRIRHWGVSNFDVDDLAELDAVPGGRACALNQVYFSLGERGPEFELLPLQRARSMPLMAYSPVDQGALAAHPALHEIAGRHSATPAQVALAWVLSRPGVSAIPRTVQSRHLRDNLAATRLALTPADFAELDRIFPPPRRKRALAMR